VRKNRGNLSMEDMPAEFGTGYFLECVDAHYQLMAFVAGAHDAQI
jgi:hypothetical protein